MDSRHFLSTPINPAPPALATANATPIFSLLNLYLLSTLRERQQEEQKSFEASLAAQADQAREGYQLAYNRPFKTSEVIGTWLCHKCSNTNPVIVIPGTHPFGILKCENAECGHVWCDECPRARMMRLWYTGGENSITLPIESKAKSGAEQYSISGTDHEPRAGSSREQIDVPYVYLCPRCGLTHRAIVSHSVRSDEQVTLYWSFGQDKKCRCGAQPPTDYEVSRP
ncbi:hypothetical protein K491DRAFT_676516 [Lophiostoma macrostomum CBS 122681]|uniref:Probable double zinc ribbon domain-containing protein n=1 Tax=Lophiostoma macrostomum CBS 122681 TaxID=1314788 RepID=A0A6A6TE36_9PLEO|nr:hypothetical protein K491DRAFT_676516 [Lophiostoma macrostomum CBS 122681]